MNIALYGFGEFGQMVFDHLKKNEEIDVVAIIDNKKYGDHVGDVEICNAKDFNTNYLGIDCVVIAILEARDAYFAYESIKNCGLNVYRVPVKYKSCFPHSNDSSVIGEFINISFNNLPYIEMRGCGHNPGHIIA